jgi:hypothetical protein
MRIATVSGTPLRLLAPGDALTSYIEDIGEMRHAFVAG